MSRTLLLRTATGLLYVGAVVACLLLHPLAYAALFALFSALTLWEFCTLLNRQAGTQLNRLITSAAGVYLFLATLAFNLGVASAAVYTPYLITLVYLLVSELYLSNPTPGLNWAYSFMAQLYVALPFALLNALAFTVHNGPGFMGVAYDWQLPLALFIFLWTSDTGAYLFGSKFGRHRLFPSISPKKSWEGSLAGACLALIASQAIALAYTPTFSSCLFWAGFAAVVVLFGTWGDLVESLLKRKLGVKDSGSILPGHGGMLDRFDSALLAIPAAIIYLQALQTFA